MTTRRERIQQGPAPVSFSNREENQIRIKVSLLTPIFGGGPTTKDPGDKITPIRGSALRGQLRFWWRATRGGKYDTIKELRDAEQRLWGLASKPGLVDLYIDMKDLNPGKPENVYEMVRGNYRPVRGQVDLAYLAFPLQPTQEQQRQNIAARTLNSHTGSFEVQINLSDGATSEDIADVKAALWAWTRFGGIGGRTRRGFGAISIPASEETEMPKDLLSSEHIINKKPPFGVPSLAPVMGAVLASLGKQTTADEAWKRLAKKYRDFRQGNGWGRNPSSSGGFAGRSRWPEPDQIRKETGNGSPEHKNPLVHVFKAPRAQFGLPIIFHFIERELTDYTLKLKDKERLASPLIIRPMGQNETFYPVALALGNRHALSDLQFEGIKNFEVEAKLNSADLASDKWPKCPLKGETDPVLAFLKQLE